MNLQPAECQKCHKKAEEGDIIFGTNGRGGDYIKRIVGPWCWSDRDECWYCKSCESSLVSECLAEIMGICREQNIPVVDFQGSFCETCDGFGKTKVFDTSASVNPLGADWYLIRCEICKGTGYVSTED